MSKNFKMALDSPLILIAEDEADIADILSGYLQKSGLRCEIAVDGQHALDLHAALNPALMILDIQMPKLSGWQVLSEIRNRGNTPVIMLTAMDQDIDKLMGLRMGADDYVVKPFNPAEVVERVLAVLRRASSEPKESNTQVLNVAPFHINLETYEVFIHNSNRKPLSLTMTEFKLLVQLAKAPRRVFSRAELLSYCLPESDALERTVDSHMSKLRKKLEILGVEGIPSVLRGAGYRLWNQK
ncbi:response regulator [Vibrio fluvialis]|uniref:response regulator n=1 Tax=Vibrio fluvialis TaxID=676 RepID=UPI001EEB556E|nr:response regulator [Vibrio fluvialis]MCG6403264.1 response regulator [Vibrio fluvialis]